jgi:hypothetical protein
MLVADNWTAEFCDEVAELSAYVGIDVRVEEDTDDLQ